MWWMMTRHGTGARLEVEVTLSLIQQVALKHIRPHRPLLGNAPNPTAAAVCAATHFSQPTRGAKSLGVTDLGFSYTIRNFLEDVFAAARVASFLHGWGPHLVVISSRQTDVYSRYRHKKEWPLRSLRLVWSSLLVRNK